MMTSIETKQWMTPLMGAVILSLVIVITACGDNDSVDSSEMSATMPSSQSTSMQVLTSQSATGDARPRLNDGRRRLLCRRGHCPADG